MLTVGVLIILVTGFGLLLAWADIRYRAEPDTLIDAIDALLPQTQCAQCGFPGCRPYAEAVATGTAINLCPPGGADTQLALARLLGREPSEPPEAGAPRKAVIDEHKCIGCYLCVQACPVDAIVGAPQLMHTVLEAACTGCELCLPPCPVDCIELVAIPAAPTAIPPARRRWPDRPATACIRCGVCQDVCPVDLRPQELLWFGRRDDTQHEATARELERCIECGLCNQVCPSNIDLVGDFQRGRQRLAARASAAHAAAAAGNRFAGHQRRLQARAAARTQRRQDRIGARARRDWQP
jgi:electron transport complex protein RnfB